MKLCATFEGEAKLAGGFGRPSPDAAVAGSDFWLVPDSHSDPDSQWYDEEYAYDGDIVNQASDNGIPGHYLELLMTTPRLCCGVQAYINGAGGTHGVEVDIHYYGGSWANIYSGNMTCNTWTEIAFTRGVVDKVRIKSTEAGYLLLHEMQFAPVAEMAGRITAEPKLAGTVAVQECSL